MKLEVMWQLQHLKDPDNGHYKDREVGWLLVFALEALKKESIRLKPIKHQLRTCHEDPNPLRSCLRRCSPPVGKWYPVLKIRLRMELEGDRAAEEHERTARQSSEASSEPCQGKSGTQDLRWRRSGR